MSIDPQIWNLGFAILRWVFLGLSGLALYLMIKNLPLPKKKKLDKPKAWRRTITYGAISLFLVIAAISITNYGPRITLDYRHMEAAKPTGEVIKTPEYEQENRSQKLRQLDRETDKRTLQRPEGRPEGIFGGLRKSTGER